MSIETTIKALTEALAENTKIHNKVLEALNSRAATPAPATKAASAEEKPAEPAAAGDAAPAEEKPKPKKAPRGKKPKEPTPAEQRKSLLADIAAYMSDVSATGSDEDKKHVKEAIGEMLRFVDAQDPATGKYVIPAIPDARVAEAVGYFASIQEGEAVKYPTAEPKEADEDMAF